MSKTVTLLFLCFLMSGFAFAQPFKKELEKAKQIKLLESTREDVRKTLTDFEHDEEQNDDRIQYFNNKNVEMTVTFSLGNNCDDLRSPWKVADGIATMITLRPTNTVKIKEFDFTNFEKETDDEEYPDYYFYHNENAGISFEIDDGEITEITFYPPKSKIGFLCENDLTKNILAGEERYSNVLESKNICLFVNHHANVTGLNLSIAEANLSCIEKDKECVARNLKITVNTTAVDPENDTLVYSYEISAGKIIGAGAKVFWDLSGVKAGTYTITAGVDDGAGVVGETKSQTVTIKECFDCPPK